MKDIIFIGGGPAGYAGAIRAQQLGLDVTIIEKDRLGGTCLNRGCIPTKTLCKNADILRYMEHLQDYGITAENISFDFAKAMERKDKVTETLVSGIEKLIETRKIEVIKGTASFVDDRTISVNGEELKAKNFIICTGSVPMRSHQEGSDLENVITSDEMLKLTELPKRLVVVGTGVIALEFASIFNAFGTKVTVVGSKLLKREDSDIQKRLQLLMKKQGITFHLKTRLKRIEKEGDDLKVFFDTKKGEEFVTSDMVLLGTGRAPYISGLNLEAIGITDAEKGIIVDENLRTQHEHIYACGDVTGRTQLAHVATYEALAIVEYIKHGEMVLDYSAVPACTFVHPEVASVGFTEDELKEKGTPYKTAKFNFVANGKALAMDETDGFVKVITDEENIIIGVHILGPNASDLIAEATLAVRHQLDVAQVEATIHAHPTLAESFHEATSAIEGLAIHQL